MESLRAYLAKLAVPQQHEYAERAGTSLGYLRKSLSVGSRFGGVLARRLDEASGGEVPRYELRPDIFGEGPDDEAPRKPSRSPSSGCTP